MKIATKIKIYTILQWVLITLTLILAIAQTLIYFKKTGEFNPVAFLLEIFLQPYLWLALILRWRIIENKKYNER